MKKYIGISLIILSFLMAIGSLASFEENQVASIVALLVISLPLYMGGHWIRTSTLSMKQNGKLWITAYIFVVGIVPLLFYTYETYENRKWNTISDGKFLLYESSSGNLGDFSIIFLMVLLLLISIRLFSPDLKRKGLMTMIIAATIFIYGGFQYMMWTDYRGVHRELGLVTQTWTGQKHIQSFDEMAGIKVRSSVYKGRLSDPTDETQFVWKIIFINKDGDNHTFQFRSLSDSLLNQALSIKEISLQKQIPFEVEKMNKKVFEWFDLELQLNELRKEPFYQFFEVE